MWLNSEGVVECSGLETNNALEHEQGCSGGPGLWAAADRVGSRAAEAARFGAVAAHKLGEPVEREVLGGSKDLSTNEICLVAKS